MNVEAIFYTQIVSILGYVAALFVLYRLLVKQKDATIELLKERISFLSNQLDVAQANSPDSLSERLSTRIKTLSEELDRLGRDHDSNKTLIQEKEEKLADLQAQKQDLEEKIESAKELLADAGCPHCGAIITERHFYPIYGYIGDREVEAEGEFASYECGYTVNEGNVQHECPYAKK